MKIKYNLININETVYYWSPYLCVQQSTLINSAVSLKKYSKTLKPLIINSVGNLVIKVKLENIVE